MTFPETAHREMQRINIHVEVPALNYQELSSNYRGEKSELIRDRVKNARERQLQRFPTEIIFCNTKMATNMAKIEEL